MAACNIFRFSPLRDRRRLSSSAFSSAESVTRWRFVRNGINHSPTQMFLWYIYQQNAHLVIQLLIEGNSIRTTQRITGVDQNTIMKILVKTGEKCEKLM